MTRSDPYPEMDQLFGVYLNQDYSYWGDTIEKVVQRYKTDSPAEDITSLLKEIDRFEQAHPHDMDQAFGTAYGFDFAPSLWGHTTASFFQELRSILKSSNANPSS